MTRAINTDLCIIGAGSAGLSVAAGAVQMGARVVLIERDRMGGDCLNTGCVPSKALLAAADRAHRLTQTAQLGVMSTGATVDFSAVKDHVRAAIDHIAPHDSVERFEGLGVHVIKGSARFTSQRKVRVGDQTIHARRFVLATGSSPALPPIPGLSDVPFLTNETIFDLRVAPDHLLILGAGPVGLEMAQAHRRLGCKVTVLEANKALGRDDPEAAAIVLRRLQSEGVDIREGARVDAVSGGDGAITLTLSSGATLTGSHLLVATGRKANLDGLDLGKAGIKLDARGNLIVGPDLRTTNKRVFAAGDVAGSLQFTHVAGYHAGPIIKQALFGLPDKTHTDHIPRATYTSPELAQIGLTEGEAKAVHGDRLEVARVDYTGNDRAVTGGQTDGFIKLMVVRGRPVGVTIVGAQAGELIALWSLVIANRLKMSAVSAMIAPYPTLAELNKRAAGAYFSPKLFDSPWVKRFVRLVQRF